MEKAVRIDWLAFTTRRNMGEVLGLFSGLSNPLVFVEKGLYGYTHSYRNDDGVNVLFAPGRPDINIQISGHGCDCGFSKLLDLVGPSDSVSRLDIAIDCMESGVTCDYIWRLLRRGQYLGDGKCEHYCGSLRENGHTIYVGSRKGDRLLRIYDKGAESGTFADWLRFEVQLRHSSANQFFLKGLKSPDWQKNCLSLLNQRLRLINPGQNGLKDNRNYDRIVLLPFWRELTDSAKPFKLEIPKSVATVQSTMRYVRNASASLKALRGAMIDYDEFIHDSVESAVLKSKHLAIQDELLRVQSANDTGPSYHFDALASLLTGPAIPERFLSGEDAVGPSAEYLMALELSEYLPKYSVNGGKFY